MPGEMRHHGSNDVSTTASITDHTWQLDSPRRFVPVGFRVIPGGFIAAIPLVASASDAHRHA